MTKALTTFLGGQHDNVSPEYLDDSEYALGVNGVNRNGHWQTRPDIVEQVSLPAGRFQGVFSFRDDLYAVISGLIYKGPDFLSTEPVEGVSLSSLARQVYATETEYHLVLSDGVGNVVAVGDYSNRRLGDRELNHIGLLCYGQGRIFFTDKERLTLQAGDIYIPGEPDSVLGITEQAFLNENLSIRQPAALGRINAMEFMRADTGTGVGLLMVFHEYGIAAYNFSTPRAGQGDTPGWLDSSLGQLILWHEGAGGPRSVVQINNDLIYRDATGVTTLRNSVSNAQQGLRSLPISMPVSNTLRRAAAWTLDYVSGSAQNNRILYTHGLRVDGHGDFYFDTLVSLDLASFYSRGETQMTWDGIWTGHKFLQVMPSRWQGRSATIVVTKQRDNGNTLCTLSTQALAEAPRTRVYTKRLFFGDTAFVLAKLQHFEIWLENIKSDTGLKVYFKGDSPFWFLAGEGTFKVPYYTSEAGNGATIHPQQRSKITLSFNSTTCDPSTLAEITRSGFFQFCIEHTGSAEISRMLFVPKPPLNNDDGKTLLCEEPDTGSVLTSTTAGVYLYEYDELDQSYYSLEDASVHYF